jgi:hypothetical protein
VRLVAAALALLQAPEPSAPRAELRAGLDTLYAGRFEAAARYFADLAARDGSAPAYPVFEAGAYVWWAKALGRRDFERRRIDSLLTLALRRAEDAGDAFWVATAYGYRARERELHGNALGAAKDAKRMRDGYRDVLAGDPGCADCLLGLGLYDYGLARVGAIARLVARVIGLGGGDAARGIRALRRAAQDGDLARVEAAWVLASALVREARRDRAGRAVLLGEARGVVDALAARYPENPVFRRFLAELPGPPS